MLGMLIENVMYFALGALVTALLALIVLPAVWRRAVRLTRRRIEAATPMTMAELRADKDQLRAQFALTTRRLEMQVEQLRGKLAEQLSEAGTRETDLAGIRAERGKHAEITRELETRVADLRARVAEYERETADLAQRLRIRDRDVAARVAELAQLRAALAADLPEATGDAVRELSGDYDEDTGRLAASLAIERKRARFLEEQATALIERLESTNRRSERAAAIAEMRRALARPNGKPDADELVAAEATIASAETRLNALLAETGKFAERPLAETLNLEEQLGVLRARIDNIESTVLADWAEGRADKTALREQLGDIAADVSRIVYAAEGQDPAREEESLFDRVQRFADDGVKVDTLPAKPARSARPPKTQGKLSDRMAALSEILGS
ncbi:hypothetical protein VE25_06555 [Devosia geojensis]|uniref:Uncharacterized protein n=1 Tax=Devosia geojensis TaxID=443610 RepID=A0A0F5FUP9_9HYPH|nr:hypothetical protein [Devosia geojensis]KKB12579.1 hypothetical protein VE25_06555 [Devosia geojensis]